MPSNENVDARLMEMLNRTRQEQPVREATPVRTATRQADTSARQNEWAAANPHACTGRSPAGRLRNFGAMGDAKLRTTFYAVSNEANDPEAILALAAEMNARGLS